ncbi:MAG: hypothetical protein MRJ68_19190 [Nitrospira sp.]|nr:hypothetical protein [Nitrospira sp.]
MRVARRHAGHPMTQEGLSDFVVDAKALQSGSEGVPEIVKVQIVDLRQGTDPCPILLERPHVAPSSKHSAVSQ